jgi:hypothetical protein
MEEDHNPYHGNEREEVVKKKIANVENNSEYNIHRSKPLCPNGGPLA